MSNRGNVSWRVSKHPSSDKLNKWCDSQANIQESISNIVLHMIEKFGYRNITDYEVQKALFNSFESISNHSFPTTEIKPAVMEESKVNISDEHKFKEEKATTSTNLPEIPNEKPLNNESNSDDDMYDELNLENL